MKFLTAWLIVLPVVAFIATMASAAQFIPLGDLPGGNFASSAQGVSADGSVVVGGVDSSSEQEAFRWTTGGGMVGLGNLPGRVAETASQMYSSNLGNFVDHFWDKEAKVFNMDLEDEIMQGALITHKGEIVSEMYKSIMNK